MNIKCPKCGNILRESDKFCNECGTKNDAAVRVANFDNSNLENPAVDKSSLDNQAFNNPTVDNPNLNDANFDNPNLTNEQEAKNPQGEDNVADYFDEDPSSNDYDESYPPQYQGRMAQKNTEKKSGGKVVLIVILALLVAAAGVFVYFFFFHDSEDASETTLPEVTETTPAAIDEKPALEKNTDEKVNREILSDIGLTLEQINTIYGEVIWNEYWLGGLGFVFENGHGMYFFDDYTECYGIDAISPGDLFIDLPGESSPTEMAEHYSLAYEDTYYSEMDDVYVSVFAYDKYSIKITTQKEGVITLDSSIFLASERFAAMQKGE